MTSAILNATTLKMALMVLTVWCVSLTSRWLMAFASPSAAVQCWVIMNANRYATLKNSSMTMETVSFAGLDM
jgi:hypothetical protein